MGKDFIRDTREIKTNPRSSGVVTEHFYQKTTTIFSLADESAELQRCRDLGLVTDTIKVVEFVSFDEDTNTLTTSKINGSDFFLLLWNSTSLLRYLKGYDKSKLEAVKSRIVESAAWLRKYHQSSKLTTSPTEELNWLIRMFDAKLSYLRKHSLFSERFIRAIRLKFLEPIESSIDKFKSDQAGHFFCRTHGDFVVYNMMLDSNARLHVLDFGDTKINSNFEDVVRFYSILLAISQTNCIRRRFFNGIADKFLQEYGIDQSGRQHPLFNCFLAYNFLVQLVGHHATRSSHSFLTYYETKSIADFGVKWLKSQL